MSAQTTGPAYVQRETRNGVPCIVLTEKQYQALRDEVERQRLDKEGLLRLLAECASAIEDELAASGADEVKQHPILASHARTAKRVCAAVAKAEGEHPPVREP